MLADKSTMRDRNNNNAAGKTSQSGSFCHVSGGVMLCVGVLIFDSDLKLWFFPAESARFQ